MSTNFLQTIHKFLQMNDESKLGLETDLEINISASRIAIAISAPIWIIPFGLGWCAVAAAEACFGLVLNEQDELNLGSLITEFERHNEIEARAEIRRQDALLLTERRARLDEEEKAGFAEVERNIAIELAALLHQLGPKPRSDQEGSEQRQLVWEEDVRTHKEQYALRLALAKANRPAPQPKLIPSALSEVEVTELQMAIAVDAEADDEAGPHRRVRRVHVGLFNAVAHAKAMIPLVRGVNDNAVRLSTRDILRMYMQQHNWRVTDIARWLDIAVELVHTPTESNIRAAKIRHTKVSGSMWARFKRFTDSKSC